MSTHARRFESALDVGRDPMTSGLMGTGCPAEENADERPQTNDPMTPAIAASAQSR